MDSGLATVVAALIALVAGLAGGFIAGKQQSTLEYQKWQRGRADDLAKEARLAVAELTKSLGAATHTMAWLTWTARNRPKHLTRQAIQNYDEEMHKLFPSISGSLSLVSALSEPLYRQMEPLVEKVYSLDEQIALAATECIEQPEGAADLLGRYHAEVSSYTENLNREVADILYGKGHKERSISPNTSAPPDGQRTHVR
jgi:hypothetical protein